MNETINKTTAINTFCNSHDSNIDVTFKNSNLVQVGTQNFVGGHDALTLHQKLIFVIYK